MKYRQTFDGTMNARDIAEFGRYVRWIANEMGLRDWHIELRVTENLPEPTGIAELDDNTESTAVCEPVPGQQKAWLHFRPSLRDDPRDEVRHIVVHELTHCHFADLREFPRSLSVRLLSSETYRAFSFGFDLAWEHAVDAIAAAWARRLPLIQWPKQKRGRKGKR